MRGDGLAEALTPILLKQLVKEKGDEYRSAATVMCVIGFFLMLVVAMLNAIPQAGAVLGRGVTLWFQFAFARAFGVMYLLPRAERVAQSLAKGRLEPDLAAKPGTGPARVP